MYNTVLCIQFSTITISCTLAYDATLKKDNSIVLNNTEVANRSILQFKLHVLIVSSSEELNSERFLLFTPYIYPHGVLVESIKEEEQV